MTTTDVGGISAQQLRSYIERIERVKEEKAGLTADVRDLYASAKSDGFDPRIMRALIRLRKLTKEDRQEQDELMALYSAALGMAE